MSDAINLEATGKTKIPNEVYFICTLISRKFEIKNT